MNPETEKWLQEVRTRLEKAPRGPYQVFKGKFILNDAGREHGFKEEREEFVCGIGTARDHPQLKGPAPILTTQHGPYYDPQHTVCISEPVAELFAHSWDDLSRFDALVAQQAEEIERLRTVNREQRRIIAGWQHHAERTAKILGCIAIDANIEQAAKALRSEANRRLIWR